MGKGQEALSCYHQARELGRAVKNPLMEADALNSIGSLRFSNGERGKSIDLFQQSLVKYREAKHWRGQSSALNNIGYYFEVLHESQTAQNYYLRALAFAKSASDREGVSATLYNLARTEAVQGQLDKARRDIEDCLSLNEVSRVKVSSHDLRASYFASVIQHYQFYVSLLMKLHSLHPRDGYDGLALPA